MTETGSTRGRRDAMAAGIGAEVRAARAASGLTMRELARRIGTSQPFVSNIENGRMFPSLRTLGLLAAALDVPVGRLLPASEPAERAAAARMRARRPGEPPTRRLLRGAGHELEAHRVELAPGEREPRPHRHDGEDFVTVLEGEVDLLRDAAPPTRLRAGDSLWLDGSAPHALAVPADAARAAIALVMVASAAGGTAHEA